MVADATPAPLRLQRTNGSGRLEVKSRGGASRIRRLAQEGASKIKLPNVASGAPLEAVLMNTAGGLTGGDRLSWSIDLEADTKAVVTTPASERIYKTSQGVAEIDVSLRARAGACLAYLPQETILFDRSALSRTLDVDLDRGASLLAVESLVFGRQAMGETVARTSIVDRWRVRSGGRLIHADDLRFGGAIPDLLGRTAVTGGRLAIATILVVHADAADWRDGLVALAGTDAGVSAWPVHDRQKLVVRIAAENGYALRKTLTPVLLRCSRNLLGSTYDGLPKVWTV
ncbi:MAG: urease accessory protein UreD [Pseudomonadota bacterium]